MAATRSRVFWLSYLPGGSESIETVVELLEKVVTSKPSAFGKRFYRDGSLVVDLLFCSRSRLRVSSVASQRHWERRGAKGQLQNAKWPAPKESPRVFLRRWADALMGIPQQGSFLGSRDSLLEAWDQYRVESRPREKEWQRRCRLRRGTERGGETSPLHEPLLEGVAALPSCDVSVTFSEADFDWSAHSWLDVDFGLPVQGWFPCTSSVRCNPGFSVLTCVFFADWFTDGRVSDVEIDAVLASFVEPTEGGCIDTLACDLSTACDTLSGVVELDLSGNWNWDDFVAL